MKQNEPIWTSLVLGMHDALVSTIGLVTGLAFADANQYIIVLTGIIAAVSAALSMTASEYLSQKAGGNSKSALFRGIMTGGAFVFTSGLLLVPFLLISRPFYAIYLTYFVAISIIWFFNYVKSRLSGGRFWPRFFEMIIICAIVTATAFVLGEGAKLLFGIDI